MGYPKDSPPPIGAANANQRPRNQQFHLHHNTTNQSGAQCFSAQDWKRVEAARSANYIADLASPHSGVKRLLLLQMAGHCAAQALGIAAPARGSSR